MASIEIKVLRAGDAESHQRRGIATQLLQAMFAHGRALGCGEARVLTERENQPAMKLYRSVGGAASDAVMFTFGLSK